jgi:hypothetical protein
LNDVLTSPVHDLLYNQGYRLAEDAWDADGRTTFVHDDSADRSFVRDLARVLQANGWRPDNTALRSFRNGTTGELLEIEPGGSDTTGHFLHVIRAGVTTIG